ncbi:MAG: FAD binding domain-containing protein [Firmicutes bacterium]|nr:FAD binding domain-containing protein [Bacillota bacterium]
MIQDYLFANDTEEALAQLYRYAGTAMVIAGGTDLMVNVADLKLKAQVLIDVTRMEGFHKIALKDGYLTIGAGVTMSEAAENELIYAYARSLAVAAACVGSVQIRNAATLGGNIVKAQPAADAAVMLVALGAVISVCGRSGKREILVEESYAGLGQSVVDPTKEIVSEIKFKALGNNQGCAYIRLAHRKALALPILNVGVILSVDERKISKVRIVMAPVDIKPQRAMAAEEYLIGKMPSRESFRTAAAMAIKDARPRDSFIHGSKEYRLSVLPSLVEKALLESMEEIYKKEGGV